MSRFRRPAAERLLACFVALAATIGGQPALAQSDPFALPKGITAQSVPARSGPGLSELSVDGETRARLVDLAWAGAALTIDADAARAAGLPVPADAKGRIALAALHLVGWRFDAVRQRLEIELYRNSDGGNFIDMTQAGPPDGTSAPLTAFQVDYDLTATVAKGRTAAAGQFNTVLSRGNVALLNAFQFTSTAPTGGSRFVRLDSQLQVLLPRAGIVATAGDFISAGGQSQRALRLGGLQIGSDYSLRPDLVINPLPSFTGQVAVPTGIDVISGDQRYKLGEVQPGEFTVRNVPASSGRGEVAVIVRDALGREVAQSTRFYASRDLLAPGIREFAANVGFVRRRYGIASNDYGPLAATAYYRRGITRGFTAEGTIESTRGIVNAGVRGDVVLANFALATIEARVSRDSVLGRSGRLFNIGLESIGKGISGRIAAILPSSGYRDVASRLGDPPPPREFLGQISFNLAVTTHVQLTASRQERRFDPLFPLLERRIDTANASFRTQLRKNVDLFASGGYRNGDRRGFTGFLGLSVQLGRGRNAQASVNGGSDAPARITAGFARRDSESNPLGYAIEAMSGPNPRVAGQIAWRGAHARFEGQVENVGGGLALRTNARGTLLMAGGALFARNQSGGSYALVRTGTVGGITVLRENRAAGVSSRKGLLLIENITPQVPLTFDVDPDKLPGDALARQTHRRMIIPRHAVGLVALDVVRFRPQPVRLTGIDGAPLAAGLVLVAEPSGEQVMVGFDGIIDFNAEGRDRRLLLVNGDNRVCAVEIDPARIVMQPNAETVPSFACRIGVPAVIAKAAAPRLWRKTTLAGRAH